MEWTTTHCVLKSLTNEEPTTMTALLALELDFPFFSLVFLAVCFLAIIGGAVCDTMCKGDKRAKQPKAKKPKPEKKPKVKKEKKPKKKKEKKKKGKQGKDEEAAQEDVEDPAAEEEPATDEEAFEVPKED
jgi:hypothetical protein